MRHQAFGDRVGKRVNRVPSPPARRRALTLSVTTGMAWFPAGPCLVLDEDVPAAMAGDPERELPRPIQRLADGPMSPGRSHQEEKSAPAGPQELTSRGTRLAGGLVPLVNLIAADPEAQRPLELPTLVQKGRESIEVAVAGQRRPHFADQIAHLPEHVHPLGGPIRLPLENLIGIAGLTGVDQERALLKLGQGLRPAGHRLDVHRVVAIEADVVDAAKGRRVLILAADRFFQDVDLDAAGLFGQERGANDTMPVGVQGVEQTNGQAAAGAHARARRHIADRCDFQRFVDLHLAHGLADQLVLDLVERAGHLGAGIAYANRRLEPAMDRHVHVLINRRAQDGPVLLPVEGRQVGSAAREADAIRSLGDDHRCCRSEPGRLTGARFRHPKLAGALTEVADDRTADKPGVASIARKQPSRFQHQPEGPFQA